MRKLKVLMLLPLLALSMTACNRQVFDFDNKFEKVHIYSEEKCYDIASWNDYTDGDQIQVKTAAGDVWLFHASDIILVHGKCPICNK